jgi:hypothetical protein
VSFGGAVNTRSFGIPGSAFVQIAEYGAACMPTIDTFITGQITLCIQYTELQYLDLVGRVIPLWPFGGMMGLFAVGLIFRAQQGG